MKAVVTPVMGRVETAAETFLMETHVREKSITACQLRSPSVHGCQGQLLSGGAAGTHLMEGCVRPLATGKDTCSSDGLQDLSILCVAGTMSKAIKKFKFPGSQASPC